MKCQECNGSGKYEGAGTLPPERCGPCLGLGVKLPEGGRCRVVADPSVIWVQPDDPVYQRLRFTSMKDGEYLVRKGDMVVATAEPPPTDLALWWLDDEVQDYPVED